MPLNSGTFIVTSHFFPLTVVILGLVTHSMEHFLLPVFTAIFAVFIAIFAGIFL